MGAGILWFILAILLVIMVHEAGHFVAAKKLGFKATKFFVGFGPTLWSFKRGETEYGVKALPLGGFVKIVGMNPYEEVPAEDRPRAYPNKPRWQRAIVILAGPATHWPLAFLVLLIVAMTIGYPVGATTEIKAVETEITEGSTPTPAARAGLRPGDRIVEVGGRAVDRWDDVTGYISTRGGRAAEFTIERDGRRREVTATLARVIFGEQGDVVEYAPPGTPIREPREGEELSGFLGIRPKERFERLGFAQAIGDSGDRVWLATKGSVISVGEIFKQMFDGRFFSALRDGGERDPTEGPVGIVGIGRIAGETVERGQFYIFLQLLISLTVFIGLMNLLPLPPLDGGHLAVIGYETITRRSVDMRKLIPIAAAFLSFLIVLSLAALYLDIFRPIQISL
ncbi:MAG: PDZ domain-containing protein [Actinobacteria bacterium]|nr:PDZ domain-containing protein [Actinomycetota bacterium]